MLQYRSATYTTPDIIWEQLSVSSNPHYGLSLNQKMLSVVDNSGLTQLVTFPTRGESILDLVLSSHSDLGPGGTRANFVYFQFLARTKLAKISQGPNFGGGRIGPTCLSQNFAD